MKIGYVPGSFHKRFKQNSMQRMNRQALQNYAAEVAAGGARLFDAIATESHGRSELAAQQTLKRIQADAFAIADHAGKNLNRIA